MRLHPAALLIGELRTCSGCGRSSAPIFTGADNGRTYDYCEECAQIGHLIRTHKKDVVGSGGFVIFEAPTRAEVEAAVVWEQYRVDYVARGSYSMPARQIPDGRWRKVVRYYGLD